jgi:hypothetical protein
MAIKIPAPYEIKEKAFPDNVLVARSPPLLTDRTDYERVTEATIG